MPRTLWRWRNSKHLWAWHILHRAHGKLAHEHFDDAYATWDLARRRHGQSMHSLDPDRVVPEDAREKEAGQAVPSRNQTSRTKALHSCAGLRQGKCMTPRLSPNKNRQDATEEEGRSRSGVLGRRRRTFGCAERGFQETSPTPRTNCGGRRSTSTRDDQPREH